jgi:rod shape-determining protein MreB
LKDKPSNLADDIRKNGIYLVGGGALLRGIAKRISANTGLSVHIAEDPLRAVARGTVIALKNFDNFPFLIDK